MNNKKKLNNFSREEIVDIVKNTNSSAAACRKLGYSVKSASCTTRLRKYLNNLNIDFSHWTGQLWSKGKTLLTDERVSKKRKIEEMFVENSEVPRSYIRNLILKNNLLEYKCKLCNILPFWNNQELVFHLDHINGIRNDHRLENLRWLCPNCHSQTDTYCGKRNTGKTKISDEDLLKSYEKTKNVYKALKELGLAGSANIKRLKKLINKGM
jgi:5-methylcytosine-specific restriction endonuclease McrA